MAKSKMNWNVYELDFDVNEYCDVAEYIDYTLAFVGYDGKRYAISVPEDTYYFDSKEELLENIRYNLNELRKEKQNERI